MRAMLQVVTGSEAGRQLVLQAGQRLNVGRSAQADFPVTSDQCMSSRHFAIEATDHGCMLHDLQSRNGTLLNGAPVQVANLADGDQIHAGDTTFVVHLEAAALDFLDAPSMVATVPVKTAPKTRGAFTATTCDSGLVQFAGSEPAAPALLKVLADSCPVLLIVDFNRLGLPANADNGPIEYLFDWVPAAAQPMCSPALLAQCPPEGAIELVGAGWGKDAVSVLFSRAEPAELIAHLRAVIHGRDRKDAAPAKDRMLGFCWPAVIAQLLAHRPAPSVTFLMESIEAVLLEDQPPNQWQVFSGPGFREELLRLGLTESPDAK